MKQKQPIEETHIYISTVEFVHFQTILPSFIYSFYVIAFLCMYTSSGVSTQTCPILCNSCRLQPAMLSHPWNFPAGILEWAAISYSILLFCIYVNNKMNPSKLTTISITKILPIIKHFKHFPICCPPLLKIKKYFNFFLKIK